MRPARFAVAALAALALAAAGCKPSSLTPFGIGDRGPDTGEGTYSGSWEGPTDSGGAVAYSVASDEVQNLVLTHITATCVTTFTIDATTALIEGDAFVLNVNLDPQGTFTLNGRFTSPDTATGSYTFDATVASSKCPNAGAGGFTAGKVPILNAQETRR